VALGFDYHFGLQNGLNPIQSVLRLPTSFQYLLENQGESFLAETEQLALKLVNMFSEKDGIRTSIKVRILVMLLMTGIDRFFYKCSHQV